MIIRTTALALALLLPLAAHGVLPPGNRVVLDIESSKENPRNSEGAFVTLKSGRILFFYTQFYGGAADESPARIVSICSDDDGQTWNREPRVVVENTGGQNVMSVSLLRLKSGGIALFYLVKNSRHDCRPWMRLSTDEAQTWSAPRLVVDAPGYFVLNNDRVIQLSTGRLVAPVAFHRARRSDPHDPRSFDSRAIALWYLSDDEGQTWREANDWWALPVASGSGLQEPGVVELAGGNVLSWARTDLGAQWGCVSTNAGLSWPPFTATSLQSPLSPASLKRLPGSADLLAVFNDHSGAFPFPPGKRTPLVAAISSDGGATWSRRKVLEDDPKGQYCYTAIHFVEGAVLLGYLDFRSNGSQASNRLRLRRVGLGWLRTPDSPKPPGTQRRVKISALGLAERFVGGCRPSLQDGIECRAKRVILQAAI
ncbi:MAG: sialidase family protein [Verrucomicrobiota bacterium]